MSEHIGWHHPVDESDQWDGFNDSGIETFAGSPLRSVAREVNQNALDAGNSEPVEVKIRLHKVNTGEIPDLDELKVNIKSCYEASKGESRKAEIFFEEALKDLEKENIHVLEVSDYNTRGMKGPSSNGTPFYAFMKAKGQSKKESETAAGSYGIGKFAPYSVSKFRTVFVSTVYEDKPGKFQQLTQAKSILMSHDIDGKRKQGVGFWGIKKKCQPICGVSPEIPSWIQRVNSEEELSKYIGSKLSVLSFDVTANWKELLAVSVAENFFGAISNDNLRVDVDGKHILDRSNINEFFNREDIRKIIEKMSNEPNQFDNCNNYLAALQKSPDVIVEESEMRELGLCQIRILIGEGLPKKVCALRNGMFITDNLNGLKSFSDFKEFVAVFRCLSTKGNELLRAMEPPKHDDFEPDRLPTKDEQKKGKRALRILSKWIRDMLKRHAKDPVSEVTQIDELKDFFGDESEDDSGKGTEEINPYGDVIIRAKPIKVKVDTAKTVGEEAKGGGGEGEDNEGGGGNVGSGGGDGRGGSGSGEGGSGGGSQKPIVSINNIRAIPLSSKERKISFTPTITGMISIRLMEAGADVDYDTSVSKSDLGEIKNGCVIVDVTAGSRFNVNVELNNDFSGALKVVAHEI